MSGPPKVYLPGGGISLLGATEAFGPLVRALSPRLRPPAERAHLTSRRLAFVVHAIGSRPNVAGALYAFAHRYGVGWRVLYVGATDDLAARLRHHHKINTAIGYGATHLLVRPTTPATSDEEAWLIRDLAPPLNGAGPGGWYA